MLFKYFFISVFINLFSANDILDLLVVIPSPRFLSEGILIIETTRLLAYLEDDATVRADYPVLDVEVDQDIDLRLFIRIVRIILTRCER